MFEERISIYKVPMDKITASGNCIKGYTDNDAIMNGELVPISNSQLIGKIYDYYSENGLDELRIRDAIINIVVPSASGHKAKAVAEEYKQLAHTGFDFNGKHFIRLCAGSGQLRNNTITYVWDVMYDYLMEAICCGIRPEDLGESFSVSKWNAYVGLSESGMKFLNHFPRVCIISDYEEIKPHYQIDYIETENLSGRKNKKVDKTITRRYYDEEDGVVFDPLNSFDGQGLADPEWMERVARELGFLKGRKGYVPSEYILRAPWCKGLVVAFDFKRYCKEFGVDSITDVFGKEHAVEDIDVLLSTSQFKMWKAYKDCGGWEYHQDCMKKYNLHWGVVIANKEKDDDYRALNYQYIQALDLSDEDIDALCADTEKLLTNLCNGNIESVYKSLIGSQSVADDDAQEPTDGYEDSKPYASLLQKAITHNSDLLNDTYIQSLIYREVESKFNGAKIGKVLCRGGYSFIVSDPVAQIQHIIKHHATSRNIDIEIKGLIPAKTIYSNYWNNISTKPDKVVLMRSPLVDSSEVTVCGLVQNEETEKWFSHIKSGLVLSIFDLNTLALQNCDFDGDRCFSSNNEILIKGAQERPVPILYPSAGTQLKGAITPDSIIDADVRGLNSAVGGLSNQATSLYALRENYKKGSPEYTELSRRIKIVSELVGVEIDKIKTGIPPKKPSAWSKEHIPYEQFNDEATNSVVKAPACSQEEQDRIRHHNDLIPDCKPIFMRYVYETLDKDLVKYDKAFNNVCKFNNGISLNELLSADYDSLSSEHKSLVDRYYRFLPAINSPCNMNKICGKFERLQAQLKKHKSSRNMLLDFETEQRYDNDVIDKIAEAVELYQRQKRFITRNNNTLCVSGNKQIAKSMKERFDMLQEHIRNKIMEYTDGDIQAAYNYLVELVRRNKCAESSVWAILDDMILCVIPEKPCLKEAV